MPLHVIAEARCLGVSELAQRAGMSEVYLQEICDGERPGSLWVWEDLESSPSVLLSLLKPEIRFDYGHLLSHGDDF